VWGEANRCNSLYLQVKTARRKIVL
jgi:hypothetical protein